MKERPIIFSADSVRAILDGRKTQTRRIVKPSPPRIEHVRSKSGADYSIFTDDCERGVFRVAGPVWAVRELMGCEPEWRCRFGVPGDRLWVRETWTHEASDISELTDAMYVGGKGPYYRSDSVHENTGLKWCSPIHMPRWASRLTLEITDVHVERLQDITDEDAKEEGVAPIESGDDCWSACNNPGREYRAAFEYVWNEMHGWSPNAFEQNHWVFVVRFAVVT